MQFASAFQYKKWANDELLELGEKQFSQLPENDATFFVRILNHTTVVDSLFISRILGEPEKYSGDNTVETPSLSELRRTMNGMIHGLLILHSRSVQMNSSEM